MSGINIDIDDERRRTQNPWLIGDYLMPEATYWAAVPCELCGSTEHYARAVGCARPFLCPTCASSAAMMVIR